jgi:formimidoylglutamate deiminase
MYQAAARLSPEDVYDVGRMCFLEMVRAGITTVGEFHYLHNTPDGTPYDDPNLLARQVIAAAQSVGLRIVLLRSAYFRSGYELPPDSGQQRFFEHPDAFLDNAAALRALYPQDSAEVRIGVAPHSVRAVPLAELHKIISWGRSNSLPIHMHISEQVAENVACRREYGHTPVELLAREGLLGKDFVAVHAIHLTAEEIAAFAESRAVVCSCPTTERNLGDGIAPVDALMASGVRHALGSDSQAQIDPLEDARELDYHLRLAQQQRAVLDQIDGRPIAARLFECATLHGAQALGAETGSLRPGEFGDMISVDLNDLSIAGNTPETLLPLLVFGASRSAIRDVVVNGRIILQDGHHPLQEEIVQKYREIYRKVWGQEIASGSIR